MFLLNIGYQWTLASLEDISGGIFLPMGNSSEKLARGSQPELSRFLIDPQLYLAGVQAERCTKICGRLATYPWFMVPDAPGFDSGAMSMRTWDAQLKEFAVKHWPGCAATEEEDIKFAANSAIEFQVQRGCTHIIFPGPLIDNREDYGETQANWLDKCIESADELDVGQPKLATVAIAEHVLNEAAFEEGGFLDTIIDQVTSRSGFDGVYILISQTVAAHPFEMSAPATRGYAYLVQGFAAHGYEFVLTNFADVFGWALLGLGATGFSTGGSQSIRRLCIDALADDGFGTPLPALYSQSVLGEFLSESDLAAR